MDNTQENKEISLWVMTDLHHLSKTLYDGGSAFQKMMLTNDAKLSEYSAEILQEFKRQVTGSDCSLLIVPGDLTFNGEMVCLREVKEVLQEIEEAGTDVVVLPGNHDIRCRHARAYEGDKVFMTEIITQEDFREEMHMFGIDGAVSADTDSFSYLYPVTEDLYILMLDANTEACPGAVPQSTLRWAEEQLEDAAAKGITVISASHQNVLVQSRFMYQGYVLDNHEETAALLERYGVFLHLSGHSHLGHVSADGKLTDICSESISVSPLQYDIITVSADRKHYGQEYRKLGILEKEADERFDETVIRMVMQELSSRDIGKEDLEAMLSLACRASGRYFRNERFTMDEGDEEAYRLWERYAPDTFWKLYIDSILDEK